MIPDLNKNKKMAKENFCFKIKVRQRCLFLGLLQQKCQLLLHKLKQEYWHFVAIRGVVGRN